MRAYYQLYPNQKPPGDEAAALRAGVRIMDARFNKYLDFDNAKERRWGEFPPQAWRDFVDAMYEGGQISTRSIDTDSLYTNALVPEYNRFDTAAVLRAAQSQK